MRNQKQYSPVEWGCGGVLGVMCGIVFILFVVPFVFGTLGLWWDKHEKEQRWEEYNHPATAPTPQTWTQN